MGPANKLVVPLMRNHDNGFRALSRDDLGAFCPRTPEQFAEARFGGLNLPGASDSLPVLHLGRRERVTFPFALRGGHLDPPVQTSLTSHIISEAAGYCQTRATVPFDPSNRSLLVERRLLDGGVGLVGCADQRRGLV